MGVDRSRPVLITGCSTGIGRATAERLGRAGWNVYATARRPESIADLGAAGCQTLALDVTDEASMSAAVERVRAEAGPVGALVNNAGYSQSGAIETIPMDSVRRQFETNVFGLMRMCQLVLPGMREAGSGRIVNVSSMGGKLTFPGGGVYHATKHAVEAISDALRFEVAGFGVEVVVIEPGLIRTEFGETAVGSIADADSRRRRAYARVQRGRRGRDRGRLPGPDVQAGRRPGGGRGEDREGARGRAAEPPLQGHRLGRDHHGHAARHDRPHVGPLRRHPVPAPGRALMEGAGEQREGAAGGIDPGADIGHVHLKVSDLDRAVAFYTEVLGFELRHDLPGRRLRLRRRLSPPHRAQRLAERGRLPSPPRSTGLFHTAIRYPTRAALATAVKRVVEAEVPLSGASDHGVSEAVYLADPDHNGIELYWDRPARAVAAARGRRHRHVHRRPRPARAAGRGGLSRPQGDTAVPSQGGITTISRDCREASRRRASHAARFRPVTRGQ